PCGQGDDAHGAGSRTGSGQDTTRSRPHPELAARDPRGDQGRCHERPQPRRAGACVAELGARLRLLVTVWETKPTRGKTGGINIQLRGPYEAIEAPKRAASRRKA